MLISKKLPQNKRGVTDFRHLKMRIAKNNLVYPLLKDTFTMLGSSKCEVMSGLDLKDAFHSLRLTESSKKVLWSMPIPWKHTMDNLLLFTPSKESHFHKLEDLLKALCINGLKISPKKCQLLKTELQYMGNTMLIKDR